MIMSYHHLSFSPSVQKSKLWDALEQQQTSQASKVLETKQLHQETKGKCPYERKEEQQRNWPTYKAIMDDINNSDYNHVLECPHDIVHKSRDGKAFCPHGTICCAQMELFPSDTSPGSSNRPYTGLLTPGTTVEHCILRLSSAMKPPRGENNPFGKLILGAVGGKLKKARLFPMVALKCFRQGKRSGNLLFAGPKIGQSSTDFFHHTMCTQMTERVPPALKPFIEKFYSYSENPLSLGVSDFCAFDSNGDGDDSASNIHFPYVVMLQPVYDSPTQTTPPSSQRRTNSKMNKSNEENFDGFIDHLLSIPSGSILFDIYVCPTPSSALDPSQIQRIGRITSTSQMILSNPSDGLFFRHQKKEEDFALRPHWKEQTKAKCSPDGGKTVGTIDRLVGSTILEGLIKSKRYMDFELHSIQVSSSS